MLRVVDERYVSAGVFDQGPAQIESPFPCTIDLGELAQQALRRDNPSVEGQGATEEQGEVGLGLAKIAPGLSYGRRERDLVEVARIPRGGRVDWPR